MTIVESKYVKTVIKYFIQKHDNATRLSFEPRVQDYAIVAV